MSLYWPWISKLSKSVGDRVLLMVVGGFLFLQKDEAGEQRLGEAGPPLLRPFFFFVFVFFKSWLLSVAVPVLELAL